MEALTPTSADDLPPPGEPIADDPFWRRPPGILEREGTAHLRGWTTSAIGDLAIGDLFMTMHAGQRAKGLQRNNPRDRRCACATPVTALGPRSRDSPADRSRVHGLGILISRDSRQDSR